MNLFYWLLGLDDASSIAGSSTWEWNSISRLPEAALALLIALALAAASLNLLRHNVMPWRTRLVLTAVRLAGFALLLLMLLQLELRLTLERVERPRVGIVTDVSGSMGLKDAGGRTRLQAAREFISGPLAPLAHQVNLTQSHFHWQLRSGDTAAEPEGITKIMDSLKELVTRDTELQAVIVLTDGNDTLGDQGKLVAPLFASRRLPVYPVVFGDPDAPRMARVKISEASSYVRLGDELPLTATLVANNLGEQTVSVRVFEEGRNEPLAARENLRLGQDPVSVRFVIKPDKPGDRLYRIVMDEVRESVSQQLLVAEHKVRVLDSKIRVLYLDIPRDERKILGHWLARDPVIELASLTLLPKGGWYGQGALQHTNAGDGLPSKEADLYKYDVLILGDIPRSYFRAGGDLSETKMQWIAEFVGRRGGGLVTLGGRTVYAAGQYQDSVLARLVPFKIEPTQEPQVAKPFRILPTSSGLGHPVMQLEADPEANREAWLDLPTLDGCNRVGKAKPGTALLAVRDLEDGPMPVLALQNVGKGKVLSLAADTTWRWEMLRPAEGEDYFRRFWGNAVRFLAPDPRIEPNKPQVLRYQSATPVGQTVTLATRLVDGVFKPILGAELLVQVTSPAGKKSHLYPRDGRESPGLYEYEIALDEPGDWKISTTYQDKTAEDRIVAGSSSEELEDPRAMPEAMDALAKATGGKSFAPAESQALLQALDVSPRRFTQTATVSLWNLPATMILFIVLVCVDCLVRKRRGMV